MERFLKSSFSFLKTTYFERSFYYQTVFEKTLKVILLFRLLSKIKRFARVTLAGRIIKPDDAEGVVEAEGEEQGVQGEGDEIIIVVEKEEDYDDDDDSEILTGSSSDPEPVVPQPTCHRSLELRLKSYSFEMFQAEDDHYIFY